jgi:hypothetical protein
VTLIQHILLQMTECHVMPFQGFRAMLDCSMGLEILLDRPFDRQAMTFIC